MDEFGTIRVTVDGYAFPLDMIVKDIQSVLEKYIANNHLVVNGKKVELKKSRFL